LIVLNDKSPTQKHKSLQVNFLTAWYGLIKGFSYVNIQRQQI